MCNYSNLQGRRLCIFDEHLGFIVQNSSSLLLVKHRVSSKTMESTDIKIEPQWLNRLKPEFDKEYMRKLKSFLASEYKAGKVIYPQKKDYFAAFNETPFESVKAVIVGQDPYHGPNQAHGLCFSVQPGIKTPPSLVNIFKELKSDLGIEPPKCGSLLSWAKEGVFLLNSSLTVEHSFAGSHQKKGWEEFTNAVLKKLNEREKPLAFILWGSFAQKKAAFVDSKKHLVLKAPHPSPLSAHRGFFGTKPFSKVNDFLKSKDIEPIDWSLN
jgi:uracil-DNA glycosylase